MLTARVHSIVALGIALVSASLPDMMWEGRNLVE